MKVILSLLLRQSLSRYIWAFKEPSKRRTLDITSEADEEFELKEEYAILCKNCGNTITTLESIIVMEGLHRHTFTNPAGIAFEIGCYSSANGCIIASEPTVEFTWFQGFSWSIALCGNCLVHLGWHYENGYKDFWGLILEQLIETTRMH